MFTDVKLASHELARSAGSVAYANRSEDPLASSLERAYRILDAFGPSDGHLTLGQLTMRTGMPKSTVHRIASSLVAWRGLQHTRGLGYSLGLRLFELGELVLKPRILRDLSLPFLEDLHKITHQTVNLVVRDGDHVLYIQRLSGSPGAPKVGRPGGHLPLHCTAVGKAILAFSGPHVLDDLVTCGLTARTRATVVSPDELRQELAVTSRQYVAIDRGECFEDVACVAAPVFAPGRRVVAAISVSGSATKFDPERAATAVRTTAAALSQTVPRPR